MAKTTKKLPAKPFNGSEGNTFSATNQPDASLKRQGWQEWRKERNLTQAVIKELIGEDGLGTNFKGYIAALVKNAKAGNPKAIDAVNKCLEDEIIKVAQTNISGEDAKTELTDSQLEKLLHAITKPG